MAVYESKVLAPMDPGTREIMQGAINHFERNIKPARIGAINTKTIADFVALRRQEPRNRRAKNPDTEKRLSIASLNKELRCMRALLRKAHKWGYLPTVPEIEFIKEPGKLPTFVSPEHFTALYKACDSATRPVEGNVAAADWWRALLVTAYMTGWRIGQILALRWEDVDLEAGTALSRAADNKGKRDQLLAIHPLVIDHLRSLRGFSASVFPFSLGRRILYDEFARIQAAAGVKPVGKKVYGFHDLRRAFATMNADRMTGDALQALMQHKDYSTTQRYINMARQLKPAVAELFVPTLITATG